MMMGMQMTIEATRQVLTRIISDSDTRVAITMMPRCVTGIRMKSTSGWDSK